MKTRIKTVKYGDGRFEYHCQVTGDQNFHFSAWSFPIFGQIIMMIELCGLLVYKTKLKCNTLDYAKEYIESIINRQRQDKLKRQEEKLKRKVVSKTYTKYP